MRKKAVHRTEGTNQKLVEWINEIIGAKNLRLGKAKQETSDSAARQTDIVITCSSADDRILCVIELKNPAFLDVFNEEALIEPARKKATSRTAPYFGTCNLRELVLFNTERANRMEPLEKQIFQRYSLSDIESSDEIEVPGIKSAIRRGLQRLLCDLSDLNSGVQSEPRLAVDEILVYRLQAAIRTLASHYLPLIESNVRKNKAFLSSLRRWFVEQGWSFTKSKDDFEKAARQTAYLLVNKILFYSAIQPIRRLDHLDIPKNLTKGSQLGSFLQNYFNEVLKLGYETIYSTDFIDQIAFPDDLEVVSEIKQLVSLLSSYDFSSIGFDVLGRIFEQLIPEVERHLLGQYFTNADVVDLILRFTLRREDDKVLDPGCGAGTFLVRSYQQKKLMNQRLTHEELLPSIWGVDISKFPAHLATINLAINDLRSNENYPRIIRKDFFDLLPDRVEFGVPPEGAKISIKGLSIEEKQIEHPGYFDAIVGNPPYTRHLEIEDIQDQVENYKGELRRKALTGLDGKAAVSISKRAGIYAYFFVHGTKFLRTGGRFGFIVANTWLDADYGAELQRHFLSNYKIVTIIESQVERWFVDADVNTCIVIMEKAEGEKLKAERDDNLVRFVYLKKPLRHFVPPAENIWEKEIARLNAIDALIRTILAHSTYYENDELRVYPESQRWLWEDGFDKGRQKYEGSKWGKYLRAPAIYAAAIDKAGSKLCRLTQLATVNEGKPTGAEEFFYPTKQTIRKLGIEKRYLHPAILRPRDKAFFELRSSDVDRCFFSVEENRAALKGTKALNYIRDGERRRIHTRDSFKAKGVWYRFGVRVPAALLLSRGVGDRHYCMLNTANAIASGSFTEIRSDHSDHVEPIWAFLNSSLGWLMIELNGRSGMGGGMLKVDPTDIRKLKVLDPQYYTRSIIPELRGMLRRPVGTVEREVASADHLVIDRYVMGEILRLSEDEQIEIRRALVQLVQSRRDRAKSVRNGKRKKAEIDLKALAREAIGHSEISSIITFYRDKMSTATSAPVKLPAPNGPTSVADTLLGWRLSRGGASIACKSEEEARYLKVFAEMLWSEAPVPNDPHFRRRHLKKWESLFEAATQVVAEYTSSLLQKSLRERFIRVFWSQVRDEMLNLGDSAFL